MDKELLKKILIGVVIVVAIWFLLIQNGGDTITILNRSGKDICELYFAYQPDVNGWGPDRLHSTIRSPHSRDIHLPIYFEWFADNPQTGYSGRAVDCDGNELMVLDGIGAEENFFIWEIR